jgi:protein ImuA
MVRRADQFNREMANRSEFLVFSAPLDIRAGSELDENKSGTNRTSSMGASEPRLNRLRDTLAKLDPGLAPQFTEAAPLVGLAAPLDAVLGGGLGCGALHELAPAQPIDLAAATGFATALGARASRGRGQMLWIATDFAALECGGPYGPGLDHYGFAAERLLMLRVPRAIDALWAFEEALRCRALSGVVAELPGKAAEADLTATRRLTLAARDGTALGLLLRHHATDAPIAAATRWRIAAAPSVPDRYGGLGLTAFDLTLVKNRRGPSGRWTVTWDHHEHQFHTALSLGLAASAGDRPDRAPLVSAG